MELAIVMKAFVTLNPDIFGLYHVSADPIFKYDLLSLVPEVYGKKIEIVPGSDFVVDRSLSSKRLQKATGQRSPEWLDLLLSMK